MREPFWQIQNVLLKEETISQVKRQMKTLNVTNVATKVILQEIAFLKRLNHLTNQQ